MDKSKILEQISIIEKEYGQWSYDIPLPYDIWTGGNLQIPHTRLNRLVQIVRDIVDKPWNECRILDLGCLDGMFSIEFAKQGAETVGIEIREGNIKKANFCKEALGLKNLEFIQENALNISIESNGMFDVIICSGLLYHLTAPDSILLLEKMYLMSKKLIIVDTHIGLEPKFNFVFDSETYWGKLYQEHQKTDSQEVKATRLLASWDNSESFWFTRPSLLNLFHKIGFTSSYECFGPPHLNFGQPGIEHPDRCTFVAIKGEKVKLFTSPVANKLNERWPENSLEYSPKRNIIQVSIGRKVINKFKKLLS